ncbi:hypothetical protein B0H16DRAFT_1687983, partial [Mycena metata]
MLLLLILVHLFSSSGTAAPALHPIAARISIPVDSCDDIDNCRKLFDIIWGCLTTIFACTWVSVHPNVPSPDEGPIAAFWQRLKMMLVALIAPEIMVGLAARQFFAARDLSKQFDVSMTHGFFFCMGGFVTSDGYPVVTKAQLITEPFGSVLHTSIKNINREDIADKGKGDALSKGLAIVQGLWFITQCLARIQQNLPLTELEVATLAFVVAMGSIWLLWWHKPLDVQRQIVVGPSQPSGTRSRAGHTKISTVGDALTLGIWGVRSDDDPSVGNSVSPFWSLPKDSNDDFGPDVLTVGVVGVLFGAIHCAAWKADFPSRREMLLWRSCAALITAVPFSAIILGGLFKFRKDALDEDSIKGILERLLRASAFITAPVVVVLAPPCYLAARIILIILMLIALRAPPPGAFMDVKWAVYIPHL